MIEEAEEDDDERTDGQYKSLVRIKSLYKMLFLKI